MNDGQRYSGKVAVVTGAASGIGQAIARRLVEEGGAVVAGDIAETGLAPLPPSWASSACRSHAT